jgi:hypothetical protein
MSNVFNPTPVSVKTGSSVNFVDRVTGQSVAYPALSLGSKTVSVTVNGVKAADTVVATINATSPLAVGLALGGARATADNTVEVTFVTPIALGLTAGSVKLDFLILGSR